MTANRSYIRLKAQDVAVRPQPPMSVGDLMTPDPIVITDETPIPDCVRLLEQSEVSGLPVVDNEGMLVGVISETDIVRAQATEYLWNRWPGLRVRHLMHAPVITADRQMPMVEAAELMERAHVHRLVVVGEDQSTPIGVVSTSDLVRALAQQIDDE